MSEVENERGYSNKSRGISRFAFPGTFFPTTTEEPRKGQKLLYDNRVYPGMRWAEDIEKKNNRIQHRQ